MTLSHQLIYGRYFAVAVLVHPQSKHEIFHADYEPASIHMTIRSLTSRICNDWTFTQEDSISAQDLIDDAITFM